VLEGKFFTANQWVPMESVRSVCVLFGDLNPPNIKPQMGNLNPKNVQVPEIHFIHPI